MAITNAQARRKWLGPVRDAYAKALIWRQLTNRRFEGDAANAYELTLNTTQASFTATETDRNTNRAPNLPQAETTSQVDDTLTMRWHHAESIYERNLDLLEGAPDKMPVAMREAAYAMATAADARTRTITMAGIPNANNGVQTASLRLGKAADFLNADGTASSVAAMKLVPQLLRAIGFRYRANNYWKLGDARFDERQPIALMGNVPYTSLLEYIDEEKPSDRLVDEYTRSDGIAVGGAVGVWKDIPIFLANELDTTVAMGGKEHYPVIISNPAAVTAAYRSPDLQVDQGGVIVNIGGTLRKLFGWSMDTEAVMGATVVNGQLLFQFGLRAEA